MIPLSRTRRILLPGFVFQSVVIAGGYGTGRELVEFFLTQGPTGGLLAMGVATLIWSLVAMVTYELARVLGAFDYRSLLKGVLGRSWLVYELAFLLFMLLILAVIAAAAGTILQETFGIPYWMGVAVIMVAVGALAPAGSSIIERVMAGWSVILYLTFLTLFLWCFHRFGTETVAAFETSHVGSGWAIAGIRYAAYNIALIPPLLFSVRGLASRRDTVMAGLLTGPIAMIPGMFFFLAMMGQYPGILDRPVPANFLLEALGSRTFQIFFQIVLFGTLIETGTGLIHGVNERIDHLLREGGRALPEVARPGVAILLLGSGTLLAGVGLVDLIARGYGTLTWIFLLVYVVPVLTVGLWKIRRVEDAPAASTTGRIPPPQAG